MMMMMMMMIWFALDGDTMYLVICNVPMGCLLELCDDERENMKEFVGKARRPTKTATLHQKDNWKTYVHKSCK